MNLSKLLEHEKVTCEGAAEIDIAGLTCDSREVRQGCLFAAFKGEKFDGMQFASKAAEMGASVILCDETSVVPEEIAAKLTVIKASEPRLLFARLVGKFYEKQPAHMVAVTGTNGKTSVAHFCRQIWHYVGEKSASIGTIGAEDGEGRRYDVASLTTPDAVGLHQVLRDMKNNGVEYAAMEASSHGLSQYRQDGVRLEAAGFTSFSRDHLDYHKTEEAYFEAKSRLFSELLPAGKTVVLNADIAEFSKLEAIAKQRQQQVISYGFKGESLKILSLKPAKAVQKIVFEAAGKSYEVDSPLIGKFQAYNLLCALGLVVASGIAIEKAVGVLHRVNAVYGRMEMVLQHNGAAVFIDYAHTPDGLEKALEELKAYASNRLITLFGCGGDRDAGKRPQMGEIACRIADVVIVTDDNPRTEDAAHIRQDILRGCNQKAVEVADRKVAIDKAVGMLQAGDLLLLAGKGHEDYQIIGTEKLPFDEKEMVQLAVKGASNG